MECTVDPASVLLNHVRTSRPRVYSKMVDILKPYPIESLAKVLREHLSSLRVDLNVFNEHRDRIAPFVLRLARAIRKNFPSGGDAFGIQLTCRLTRNATQDTLDSRHLKAGLCDGGGTERRGCFGKEGDEWTRALQHELDLYKVQSQVLEVSCRKKFTSVYLRDTCPCCEQTSTLRNLRGAFGKGDGHGVVLEPFSVAVVGGASPRLARFLLVVEGEVVRRVLYHQQPSRDLSYLLTHVPLCLFEAFNDFRQVNEKCGVTCYFFNAASVVRRYFGRDPKHERDFLTALKAQLSTGRPLPFNREGLAKHPGRSPLEVVSFEALKKNCSRMATSPNEGCVVVGGGDGKGGGEEVSSFVYPVEPSTDKMFFGQPFNEGTGYTFAVLPDPPSRDRRRGQGGPSVVESSSPQRFE